MVVAHSREGTVEIVLSSGLDIYVVSGTNEANPFLWIGHGYERTVESRVTGNCI